MLSNLYQARNEDMDFETEELGSEDENSSIYYLELYGDKNSNIYINSSDLVIFGELLNLNNLIEKKVEESNKYKKFSKIRCN